MNRPAWRTLAVAGGIAALAALVVVVPPKRGSTTVTRVLASVQPGAWQPGTAPSGVATTAPARSRPVPPSRPGLSCAGDNGGATADGVTRTAIKLGATVVDSGIGASFLRDARFGMLAVKDRVNRAGGICGRKLQLKLVDDEWDPQLGAQYIQNLIDGDRVFALAVVPSSEGLRTASSYIVKKKVPVVGSDGMLIHQYKNPYIWPVAASTVSTMNIMAQQAHDAGARHFGIVYEHTYHFGLEGAYAFNAAVRKLTGHDVPGYSNPLSTPRCEERFCGIAAGAASYGPDIQRFNAACLSGDKCDFVALLLEPATAIGWITGGGLSPSDGIRMGGPQPLFTRSFAQECGAKCHNLWLWTGYDPPFGGNLGRPAVARYLNAIKSASSSADPTNTFVQGAYIGMEMLVEALHRTGPELTRERLVGVLDGMRFETGLSAPLVWTRGDHFANTTMQAWSIQYKDRFSGWRDERVRLVDPFGDSLLPRSIS